MVHFMDDSMHGAANTASASGEANKIHMMTATIPVKNSWSKMNKYDQKQIWKYFCLKIIIIPIPRSTH